MYLYLPQEKSLFNSLYSYPWVGVKRHTRAKTKWIEKEDSRMPDKPSNKTLIIIECYVFLQFTILDLAHGPIRAINIDLK